MTIMTTDHGLGTPAPFPARLSLWFRLRLALAQWRNRRRIIRTHMALARLDPRLLQDLGLEPLDLSEALRRNRDDQGRGQG
jgi:uncharacterized protein YjiS (DUF1127 family)